MNLLEEIVAWDSAWLHARAINHRAPDHPLRRAGQLSAICGIEYAAQGVALHGVLNAQDQGPGAGLLASVRAVTLEVDRLDDIQGVLDIAVTQVAATGSTVLYEFCMSSSERPLLSGRLAIVLHPPQFEAPA
ncbi:MAG: 3-hydroxylacyl-ACP dehydratase [Pseudomonadota bacterium]|nr:3-hydroxylacyl-ACP dehydratase [Pseudomonadota bacterium]